MIKILYEDNHLLVVVKPINMPVCEDSSGDLDLLTYLKGYIKDKYNKPGNVYLGLIHRLDRPVSGIMVFAKTSKCASRLSEQVRSGKLHKKYYAVICGSLKGSGVFNDKLLKDSRTNMVCVDSRGKDSSLEYNVISSKGNFSLVDINLITGRSHQIRVQFSSRGYPLYGDQRYNKSASVGEQIALFSYYLSFFHPISGDLIEFIEDIPNRKPFDLFKDN
ncbi:MAG: RluA family pseudouridine synthase [Bacilli bacterium]